MFDYEDFYKLYNDRAQKKYDELVSFLRQFVSEGSRGGKEKGFRERMMNFSRQQASLLYVLTQIEEKYTPSYVRSCSLQSLKEDQDRLFRDLLPDGYEGSCLNPSYMNSQGGRDLGLVLSSLAAAFREGIADAFCHRRFRLVRLIELYFEMHKLLTRSTVRADQLQDLYRQYRVDQATTLYALCFHKKFDPSDRMMQSIVMEEDLKEADYLYLVGLPVTEAVLETRKQVADLPEEKIREAASHLASRMKANQIVKFRDFADRRNLVSITIPMGTEILAKALVEELEKAGLYGFISEIRPQGISPKFMADHMYDLIRGLDEEQAGVLEGSVRTLGEGNEPLLKGFLGHICICLSSESGDQAADDPLRDQVLRLQEAQEKLINEMNGQDEIPVLTMVIPSPEEKTNYTGVFDALMEAQIRSELQAERANQVVADAIGSGYALYLGGQGENDTDLTISLSGTKLVRNAGSLPCGEVIVRTQSAGTSGILHLPEMVVGGRCLKNLHLSFEEGVLAGLSYDEQDQDDQDRVLATFRDTPVSRLSFGLNMNLLEKVRLSSLQCALPDQILSKTCLKIEFGPGMCASFPYDRIRSVCSIKMGGQRTDIIREGMFMPIGSDAMNVPLMRIRKELSLNG